MFGFYRNGLLFLLPEAVFAQARSCSTCISFTIEPMKKQFNWPLLLLLAPVFLFLQCKKTVKNEAYYQAISKYIYAYTSGAIDPKDAIRVRFVDALVGTEQINKPVSEGILDISPKIPGLLIWEDERTIKLTPNSPLPYGAKYEAVLSLNKLIKNVPKEIRQFDFNFSVKELAFDVIVQGLQTQDMQNLTKQMVMGEIRTSDPVDNASLEQVLTAHQRTKSLSISWIHAENATVHLFKVMDVERSQSRSSVTLNWNGSPIGVKLTGSSELDVPSLGEFVVQKVEVVQDNEQYVLINFSDPIYPTQDLRGLISIEGYNGQLRYVIDGNFCRVYPTPRITENKNIHISNGILNIANGKMPEGMSVSLDFEPMKPGVRLVGRGNIIPENSKGEIIFPFEATGLDAVDVEVFKIYQSNILQFLQVNDLEGENELERVGKIIMQRKISLTDLNSNANLHTWTRYALNLKDIINQDPASIYQIRLAFRKAYTTSTCTNESESFESDDALAHIGVTDENDNLVSILGDYRGIYTFSNRYDYEDESDVGDEGGYNWENRDDPCKKEYYNRDHFVSRNVFVSDLGLSVKRGKDNSMFVAVNDLNTSDAVSGVSLDFYNYQLQKIISLQSDGQGTARVENLKEQPFVVVARSGNRKGYLRLSDGTSLSLSRFDVDGVETQKGLKGYLYGERGVWRPGDSLFLNFVLEDNVGNLPENHPLSLELTDSRGAMQYKTTSSSGVNGVYPFHFATNPDAPTGNWMAKVKVGGAVFSQSLKIETVKPNRLKINFDFGKKELSRDDQQITGNLSTQWLTGAIARNLKAKIEMQIQPGATKFKNFDDYTFTDPTRRFSTDPQVVFDGNVNEQGTATVPVNFSGNLDAPGKLVVNFRTRVFEQSGDFSTDNFAIDYSPYNAYVGIKIKQNSWGSKEIDKEKGGEVHIVCVDQNGKPLANKELTVGLYRLTWRWWWDSDSDNSLGQYNTANHIGALQTAVLKTNSQGEISWFVRPNEWGRYMVRVTDPAGGHSAGDFFWSGYPEGSMDLHDKQAASMLPFSTDKPKYATGETVTIKVPGSVGGKLLVTLENGVRVLDHFWQEVSTGENLVRFKVDKSMSPTIYAHLSLMQPHAQTANDLPIRLYGVVPIQVEDPSTHLEPQISMPEVLKPGQSFDIKLNEKSGKACAYTLAIVDEGLLDLTRFKTPNPWDVFYAQEALGVKSWDVYDYVLGSYGAQMERLLGIGGDGINQKARAGAQVNRFKPVVQHFGPFYLEKGKTATHKVKIENYVGSVRIMAVCSNPEKAAKGAYGATEKTCPVRQPLMILPTLPRVLSPGETLRMPVNVFAMEKHVKNAVVTIKETSGLVQTDNEGKSLNFAEIGDKMAFFDLKVGGKTGVAKFKINATGSGESSSEEIEIEVRSPNPVITSVTEAMVEAGQSWQKDLNLAQYAELKNAVVEVSAIPPMNLSKHLEYLINYPHGCLEQTTSTAFPQLYVDMAMPLSTKQTQRVEKNVKAAISKIGNFQVSSGGFSYWPGSGGEDTWATSYVGHFLLEAKSKGYAVPDYLVDKWISFQTNTAKSWAVSSSNQSAYHDSELDQAYRLYCLALAGKPEVGSMNALREKKELYHTSACLLAYAYATIGKAETAQDLLKRNQYAVWNWDYWGHTYGSNLRDHALVLEVLTKTGDKQKAQVEAEFIAQNLGQADRWYSTQELAVCLRAIGKYLGVSGNGNGPSFSYALGNSWKENTSTKPISLIDIDESASSSKFSIKNKGNAPIYIRVITTGKPVTTQPIAAVNKNIQMDVRYTDTKGTAIDVSKLKQGMDFIAEITVARTGPFQFDYTELAISQIFPSGWEILNARLSNVGIANSSAAKYQDIRDDRIYTYFDLFSNNTAKNTFKVQLNAAYPGKYYLPPVSCEAMYDERIRANTGGKWVEVI